MEDVAALFTQSREVGPNDGEVLGACDGTKATGSFLLQFRRRSQSWLRCLAHRLCPGDLRDYLRYRPKPDLIRDSGGHHV